MANSQAGGNRRVDWLAASLGLILAVVAQLAGGALLFPARGGGFVGDALLTFGALLAGGFLAGFIGPVSGVVWNGILVAIGFILVVGLATTFFQAPFSGAGGLAAGDTTSLVIGDLLVLAGGTLGGVLAGSAQRVRHR